MTYYHGTFNDSLTLHIGLCLTDSEQSAEAYAGNNGVVFEVELDLDDLNVVAVDGYDHDNDCAPGDTEASLAELLATGADVITFADEDQYGRSHDCYRIISPRALAACRVVEIAE